MTREEKIKESKRLHNEFLHLRANGQMQESLKVERDYLVLRKELIEEVTTEVKEKKSVHISSIAERVKNRVKKPKRETGIRSLDRELVTDKDYYLGKSGGIPRGNLIMLAGSKGAGKTTFFTKIMASISNYETTSWFNFEMSDEKVIETLSNFQYKNIEYYEGSRDISDIKDEIKYLYAMGVYEFFIDSTMKIKVKGIERGHASFSYISSELAELTSTLGINIWLIQQISSESQKTGALLIKHGNDAEYDADYIFFAIRATTGKKDEAGQDIIDNTKRYLVCTKNRVDHRTFTVEIPKSEIFGIEADVIEYEG